MKTILSYFFSLNLKFTIAVNYYLSVLNWEHVIASSTFLLLFFFGGGEGGEGGK